MKLKTNKKQLPNLSGTIKVFEEVRYNTLLLGENWAFDSVGRTKKKKQKQKKNPQNKTKKQ